jgi:hypothetical protein
MKNFITLNNPNKTDYIIGISLIIIVIVITSSLAILANIDLSQGKHVLYMDELITL